MLPEEVHGISTCCVVRVLLMYLSGSIYICTESEYDKIGQRKEPLPTIFSYEIEL